MAEADRGSGSRRRSSGSAPAAGALIAATALALAAAGWTAFQWNELAAARSGEAFTCAFGDGAACAAAWNSPFAKAVEGASGLPVAGWGLLWSLLALALPLGAWLRRAEPEPWWSATRLVALGGVVVSVGLAALLLATGQPCANCLITHGLVLAYGAVCLLRGPRMTAPAAGAAVCAGLGVLGFAGLLALGPAVGSESSGASILANAPRIAAETPPPQGAAPSQPAAAEPSSGDSAPSEPAAAAKPDREETPRDRALREFLEAAPPAALQAIADALASWARSPARPVRPPRALIGPTTAPVRITEFADALCSHCASLHRTLREIRERVPPDSLAIEPRAFPLDGACNPQIPTVTKDALSCTAARAMICMEGRPGAFAFAGEIFENQRSLDETRIFSAAKPYIGADALRTCMAAPETQARLQSDIDWAVERGIKGTPLVLVNGREAAALPPFLYALVLAEGDPGHPAFRLLPPPRS